jgi:hypothetical protein
LASAVQTGRGPPAGQPRVAEYEQFGAAFTRFLIACLSPSPRATSRRQTRSKPRLRSPARAVQR